jgi:hypothetical protein
MMAQLGANPVFTDDDWHDLSRAQVRERTLKRVREAYKLLITDGSDVTRRNCRWGKGSPWGSCVLLANLPMAWALIEVASRI